MLRGTGDLERKRLGLCACCLQALKCCSLRTGWRIVFIAHEEQSRCYKLRTLNSYITWVMSTGGPASSKRGSCLFLPEEVFSPRNASLSDLFQKTQKCSCENSVFKWSQWIYDFIKTLWGAIQSKSTGGGVDSAESGLYAVSRVKGTLVTHGLSHNWTVNSWRKDLVFSIQKCPGP